MKNFYLVIAGQRSGRGFRVACVALGGLSLSAAAQQPAPVSARSQPAAIAVSPVSASAADSPAEIEGTYSAIEESGVSSSSPVLMTVASVSLPELPEAPQPQLHKLNSAAPLPGQTQPVSPITSSVIPPGYRAHSLTAHNKMVLGVRDLYSFETLAAIALSAGYSHISDGQPNYGVNSKAFAQRLGAAAARETSEGVFTEIVMAPLLHEDPRYYVMGPSANLLKRAVYAVTRPLITRTDSGNRTVNGALLIGYAGASALTSTYYPQSNRNFHDVASTFGGSIGGAALGDFISEFAGDVLTTLHLKRLP